MQNIAPKVIEYFIVNELQLAESIDSNNTRYISEDLGTIQYRSGYVMFRYTTDEGNIDFSPIDFLAWRTNKNYYNSPLYRALYEEV